MRKLFASTKTLDIGVEDGRISSVLISAGEGVTTMVVGIAVDTVPGLGERATAGVVGILEIVFDGVDAMIVASEPSLLSPPPESRKLNNRKINPVIVITDNPKVKIHTIPELPRLRCPE
jgi:F420-dependent methylenetetrahydromethanopterin dehydrogenase